MNQSKQSLITVESSAFLQRVKAAASAVKKLAEQSEFIFSEDALTHQFCKKYLQEMLTEEQLMQKVQNELKQAEWQSLGTLLLIVSENDVLGTTLAFLGAYITGNQMVIKARESRVILDFLKQALTLSDEEVKILNWQGGEQDDAVLLTEVDGVLLAGGAGLIQHFRQVTPPNIRLIEFGPKLSAIALGHYLKTEMVAKVAQQLINEVTIFQQKVCSSPRFILLESQSIAKELFAEISRKLTSMPVLNQTVQLAQAAKYAELKMLKQAFVHGLNDVYFSPETGWGATLSTQLEPSLWFDKGFHFVVGDVNQNIKVANQLWRGSLQTLGMAGVDEEDFNFQGFTRYCELGEMHRRPITAPHDGFFELSSLVIFIGRGIK